MTQIKITDITGTTPIDIYVADVYGNHKKLLGQITGNTITPVPPINYQYPSSIFDKSPSIMLILSGADGNQKFKILNGISGCTFNVILEMTGCTTQLNIT